MYKAEEEIATIRGELAKVIADKDFLEKKVDSLVREKRTDVVKQLEDEVEALRAKEVENEFTIANLRAEKTKVLHCV